MPTCFSPTFEFVYTNTPFCWSWMKCVAHMWKREGRTRFSRQHLEQRKELDIQIRNFVPPFLLRKKNHLYLEIRELWFEQPDEFAHIVDSSTFKFLTRTIITIIKVQNTSLFLRVRKRHIVSGWRTLALRIRIRSTGWALHNFVTLARSSRLRPRHLMMMGRPATVVFVL